jgi:DNA-binding beta-propeller fold protein YncE
MPILGTLTSSSLGTFGLAQQAQIAILKASTSIPTTGTADWSNATLAYTLDNPNAYDTSAGDQFGLPLEIDGDFAIVGAYTEDDAGGTSSGKAYIYNATTGALVHTLDNPNAYDTSEGDFFGRTVAISGDYAIVGAHAEDDAGGTNSGKAYIFNVTSGLLVHTLDNPNPYAPNSQNGGDRFGWVVAISGDYAIVGATYESDQSGKAYIYNVTTGVLVHTLDNPNPYGGTYQDEFGYSVAISGDYTIVGAYAEDDLGGTSSGKAYIFNVTSGLLVHTLDNPNPFGTSTDDYFGRTVAISGDHAIVGAVREDDGGDAAGKAYIFNVTSGLLVHTLDNPNAYSSPASDLFGDSVAISGDYAIVSAFGEDDSDGTFSGKAYIFNVTSGLLVHTLDNPNAYSSPASDLFGDSVAISGDYAIVSAFGEDDSDGTFSGKAYIFNVTSGLLVHTLDNPNPYGTSSADRFGWGMEGNRGVSISGGRAMVGASYEDDTGGTSSGKAYIFQAAVAQESTESTGWSIDLSNVTYDSVSFGIGNLDGTPYQITFNADGTKMYQLGANTKRVIQYTLSTAFDLSTAPTLSGTFDINASGQETSPSALFFSTDGTKMYICGFANATVYQYSLSVAFDISTAIYANQAYDISIQESYPTGIVFNPDGTKMYVCGFGDNIHEYGLTTAFDVSSASFNNVSFSVTNQAAYGWGFRFNADGTKMYVVSASTDTVYQYSLATAFDLSSTSYDNVSISVNSQDSDPLDIAFNTDGTKMYVSGSHTDTVYQYSTGL